MMTDPSDVWEALCDFVRDRVDEGKEFNGAPIHPMALYTAVEQVLNTAEYWDVSDLAEYQRGYSDAFEDALRMVSGIWKYHRDYEGWAEDDDE